MSDVPSNLQKASRRKPYHSPRTLVSCKTCGVSWMKDRHHLKEWAGNCRACAYAERSRRWKEAPPWELKPTHVTVTCKNCGVSWSKLRTTLRLWQGCCRSCASSARFLDPAFRERAREISRQALLARGGIPGGHRFQKGEKPANYKGGITPELQRIRNSEEHKAWAKAVKIRDNFTCQMCGKRGGALHSDHILSFAEHPEHRFDLDNGRTLCHSCHAKHHRRKEWTRWKPR